MLIAKGSRCSFDMDDDDESTIQAKGLTMLHDPTGKYWPKCSLLFAPFKPGGRAATEAEMKGAPRAYLGKSYVGHVNDVELPPKDLAGWQDEGFIAEIWYFRRGKKFPFYFRHPFGKKWTVISLFKGTGNAKLYSYGGGRYFRVQLTNGCILDDRGIAWP